MIRRNMARMVVLYQTVKYLRFRQVWYSVVRAGSRCVAYGTWQDVVDRFVGLMQRCGRAGVNSSVYNIQMYRSSGHRSVMYQSYL